MCGIKLDIEPACYLTRPSRRIKHTPRNCLPFCFVFFFLTCSFLFRLAPCGFPSLSIFIFFFFCLSYSTFGWHAALTFMFAFFLFPFAFAALSGVVHILFSLFWSSLSASSAAAGRDPMTLELMPDGPRPQLINAHCPRGFPVTFQSSLADLYSGYLANDLGRVSL